MISVFSKQCLDRRIGDEGILKREIAALEAQRNQAQATIDWRFTTGALIGVAAALLYAPNKGTVTRKNVWEKGTEYVGALREKVRRDGGSRTS